MENDSIKNTKQTVDLIGHAYLWFAILKADTYSYNFNSKYAKRYKILVVKKSCDNI